MTREAHVHGLVASFDVVFEHNCTTPVRLSTAAETESTHWKQTFFHFAPLEDKTPPLEAEQAAQGMSSKPFRVSAGDEITGTFSLKRSARNARELDFEISWFQHEERFIQKFHMT